MKKVLAILVSASMVMALAACNNDGGSKKSSGIDEKEAVAIAENFASAVTSAKTKSVSKLCGDDDSWEDLFDEIINSTEVVGDTKEAHQAILSTLTYEVDDDSVSAKKNSATVDVTFSVNNFEKLDAEDYDDIDEYIDDLEDLSKTLDITVEVEIESEDDSLYITNCKEILEEIYVWEDLEVEFDYYEPVETTKDTEETTKATEETKETTAETTADSDELTYADGVEATMFWSAGTSYESGYEYENVVLIECDVLVKEGYEFLDWEDDVIVEMYYEGELIFTEAAMILNDQSDGRTYCYMLSNCAIFDPDVQDPETMFMKEGKYEFYFYDDQDNVIAYDYCYCTYYDKGYEWDVEDGDSLELYNIAFYDWYYMEDDGLEFDMYLSRSGYQMKFLYEVQKDGEVIYTSDLMTDSGSFVDAYLTPEMCGLTKFESGEYTMTVYDEYDDIICTTVINH